MLHTNMAVIVEGKYDKIKLSSIIDAVIIPTNGFGVFRDKEKMSLIRYYASNTGIIIMTDSDTAGFKIRNHIKGSVGNAKVVNVYIPDIYGKERRKTEYSKEGKLGVEGVPDKIIIESFKKAGISFTDKTEPSQPITKLDLFEDGLSGGKESSEMRRLLLKHLGLPELLTTNSMLEVLNVMLTKEQYKEAVRAIEKNIPVKE